MGAKEIEGGGVVISVSIRDQIAAGLASARDKLEAFGARVGAVGKAAMIGGAALTGIGAATGAPLVAAAASFAEAGAAIDDMSQRTGIGAESLSALSHAASMSGTSMQTVEGGVRKLQKAIGEAASGNKSAIETFDKIGLSIDKLLKLSPDRQFAAVAAQIAKIEDPTLRAAAAMEIFGKSGAELVPLISSNVSELIDEAHRLGVVLSTEDVAAAARLDDAFQAMRNSVGAAWQQIGAAIAEPLAAVVEFGTRVVAMATQFIRDHKAMIQTIAAFATATSGAGIAMTIFGGILVGLSAVVSAASSLMGLLSAAAAAVGLPVLTLVGAVAAGVAVFVALAAAQAYVLAQSGLLSSAIEFLSSRFSSLFSVVRQTFQGISAALSAGDWRLAASIAWAGIKVVFLQGAQAVLDAIAGLWNNALTITGRFWHAFAQMAYNVFQRIPALLMAALKGGVGFNQILADALTGSLDLSGMLDSPLAEARSQLAKLQAEALAKQRAGATQSRGAPVGPGSPGLTPEQLGADRARARAASEGWGAEDPRIVAMRNENLRAMREAEARARQPAPRPPATPAQQAKSDLEKAIAKATAGAAKQGPKIPELEKKIDGAKQEAVKLSSTGTFSALGAALMGLGAGGSDDRTANNTATMAAILRRMEKRRQAVARWG